MAELRCSDGTVIQISDETEQELKKAFGPKPDYKDSALRVHIERNKDWPITIRIAKDYTAGKDYISRDIGGVKKFIIALQECVDYCEQHNLGII